VNYENAGTVEFLLDVDTGKFSFIEVNPRIQVEHTVTEETTGVDIVKCQILVAQGARLDDAEIDLGDQSKVQTNGFALQCRVTTEDAANNFTPDHGRISHYRSASGMGIRLDAGTAFSGAVVTPFYDSLLVKTTAWGRTFLECTRRMERSLQEFRVRGVKTNLPFLIKLMAHPTFIAGDCTTRFIDETPELFDFPERRDRATRLLTFVADVIINGNSLVAGRPVALRRTPVAAPKFDESAAAPPHGMRQRLESLGPEGLSKWIRECDQLLLTDTTFRDAHQSLFATRVRTFDMLAVAEAYARLCPELFSIEMWGGATFDVAMRFLKECPWQRLTDLRQRIPNILFQMLLRSANAVGYTNYPDNVVSTFIAESAAAGIDVFRIFDALNNVADMRVAIDAVHQAGAVCEAAICYSGDLLDPRRTKYDLKYYVGLAKQLEKMGAHILAIKDMAGLCKPYAAERLVKTLKQEISLPIHFHTHDTAGVQAASILKGAEAGLDIADGAMAPMSGGTSQPNLNTLVEALRNTPRDAKIASESLDRLAEYWRSAREFYAPFESPVLAAGADLYRHEMPGGQYTNLFEQARALGLSDRWSEVCQTYADVNQLFGDIVKVTPTSKAVGDMALFLIANDLKASDVLDGERELAFPQSVLDLIGGAMGQPIGGFPKAIEKRILGDRKPLKTRPGETLPPADLEKANAEAAELLGDGDGASPRDASSLLLYPKVFRQFAEHQREYGDVSVLPTYVFLHGMQTGEEIAVDIEPGKTLIIKMMAVSEPHEGTRTVFFELNGQPREVTVADLSLEQQATAREAADPKNPKHVAAPMPGLVVTVAVAQGDAVTKGQKLLMLEAMKMQTTVVAERDGRIARLLVTPGAQVEAGDLAIEFE
jgi:pyruvate carboxylase